MLDARAPAYSRDALRPPARRCRPARCRHRRAPGRRRPTGSARSPGPCARRPCRSCPPCSAAMRRWPTESICAKRACAAATVAVVEVPDQLGGGAPRPRPRSRARSRAGGCRSSACGRAWRRAARTSATFSRHRGRRLAPGQVDVDLLGGQLVRGVRRAAEVQRRIGSLHRRVQQLGALDAAGACRRSRASRRRGCAPGSRARSSGTRRDCS